MVWREGYDIHTYNLVRWAGVDPRDGAPLWYDAKGNITRIYSTDKMCIRDSPLRLRQIVNNLLSNAVKFTQKGEISLTASYDSSKLTIAKMCIRDRHHSLFG